MAVIRSFDIKRLRPFHREGDGLPKTGPERSDELAALDPNLRPDEESYVIHYLNYADVLLNEGKDGAANWQPRPRDARAPAVREQEESQNNEDDGNNRAA
jgi:hypothetical protein